MIQNRNFLAYFIKINKKNKKQNFNNLFKYKLNDDNKILFKSLSKKHLLYKHNIYSINKEKLKRF